MGRADSVLGYRELLGEVRRLCGQRQTGSIFITTSDNYSVRFALQNGLIIALGFRNQTGMEAIASIQRISKGRLQFSDGLPPQQPQAGLPSTPELLALLERGDSDASDGEAANAGHLSEVLVGNRAVIEAELVEYLGPMARVVLSEHIATARTLNDLIESLAREVSDPDKSARFKERVRERLAASVSGRAGR